MERRALLLSLRAALFAFGLQACARGVDAPQTSRSDDDVSARAAKLLGPGNSRGRTIWGGPGDEVGTAVARDAAGNIYVAGTTTSFGAGGSDILILKYGSAGLEWARTWGGAGEDVGRGIAVGPDGMVYVVGGTTSFTVGWYDMVVLKLDAAGVIAWSKTWGGSSFDYAYDLAFDDAGNVIVTGESYECGAGCANAATLMKIAPDGAPVWMTAYRANSATYTSGYSITVDAAGDIVVGGTNWFFGAENYDSIVVAKLDTNGSYKWLSEWTTPPPGQNESMTFHAVTTDPDRNIYVGGRHRFTCTDSSCDFETLVLKLEPVIGSLQWARTEPAFGWDTAASLAWDPSGQLLVAGVRDGFGRPAYFVSRYDGSGILLDHRRWTLNEPASAQGTTGIGMALAPDHQAIFVGQARNMGSAFWKQEPITTRDVTARGVAGDLLIGVVNDSFPLVFFSPSLIGQDLSTPLVDPAGGVVDSGGGGMDVLLSVDDNPSPSVIVTVSGGGPVAPSPLIFQVDGVPVSADSIGSGAYAIFGLALGSHFVTAYNGNAGSCGIPLNPLGGADFVTTSGTTATADLRVNAGRLVARLTVNGGWFVPGEQVSLALSGSSGCPIIASDPSGRVDAALPPGTYSAVISTSRGNRLGYLTFAINHGQVTDLRTVDLSSEQVNIALNPTCSGFPTPLESDHGWGGGAIPCDIVDGKLSYETWSHGLAFTGGHQTAAGGPPYLEPAGVRHAVIDFDTQRTFHGMTIWWHGAEYTPDVGTLEVWDDSAWVPIAGVNRQYGTVHVEGNDGGYADSDMYTFPAVTGSRIRYTFDNSGNNIVGTLNIHGWIYEMEVWADLGAAADGGTPGDGGTAQTCAHDICATGAALSRTCSQGFFCPAEICFTNPQCCAVTWDQACVDAVGTVCLIACGGDGGSPSGGAPIGAPCTAVGDCVLGAYCTDGFCCDKACGNSHDDDCQVCSAAKGATANGRCTMLPSTRLCRESNGIHSSNGTVCDLGAYCTGSDGECPPNKSDSTATCYTRPAGDQCAAQEAAIACGSHLTCPQSTLWQDQGCEAPDSSGLVTLHDDAAALGTVTVQFPYSWDGTISVTRATGCPPATGFTFSPAIDPTVDPASIYWDLNADPPLDCAMGEVEVCVTYPQGWFGPVEDPMEAQLQLRHGNQSAQIDEFTCDPVLARWDYLTRSRPVDTVNNRVCANTCTLSPFALMIPRSAAQIPTVRPPAPIVAEASSAAGAVVTLAATATDLEDGPIVPTCLPASGSLFPIGTTTVTCQANDSDHLTGSATFTVTVVDTKGPVFSNVPPSPIVAYATSTAGAKVTYTTPTATDGVDGRVAVACAPASGCTFAPGKTTVICNAADSGGRAATPAKFTIWVQYQAPADGTFFLPPINADGSSIFNGGTIPVKFKLTGASASIANLTARLLVTKLSSGVSGSVLEATSSSAADSGNVFRYDQASHQYIFNFATKSLSAGTWSLRADLGDGVDHQINVSLKGK